MRGQAREEAPPRTLRLKQWMVSGLLIFVVLTSLGYHVIDRAYQSVFQPSASQQPAQREAALDTALGAVAGDDARWRDPAWQATWRDTLDRLGVRGVLLDPHGAEIVRVGYSGDERGERWRWAAQPDRRAVLLDNGRQLGTVELFAPTGPVGLGPFWVLIALGITLFFVGRQIGRYVIRPLEAMSQAARRIAGGDLNFVLPDSRVREVAEVRAAFEAMGTGLRASIARQAALEEERRFFIGAIAHDLRTPLFALRGYLEGLDRGLATTPEKAAHYLAVCRQKADQLERLVADLFAYTKAEYLEQTVRREEVVLGPLFERALVGLRPRAQAKGVAISLAGAAACAPIAGDAHLLERAVENLLDNALRHTPAGGTITISCHADADRATFTVADSGPGIAARDLPHLFEPLYRGEASRNPETGGVGLGLTIARRILRAHGGDLVAANRPGGGAEFTAWLACPASAPVTGIAAVAGVGLP
jgi:signal transduction histidine kinase